MKPAVLVERAAASYGGRTAVEDVSLVVEPGEVVGVLGPNGAGKTTTMRMVLGLLQPDAGRVEVAGTPGHLPEAPLGEDALSVATTLRFHGTVRGIGRSVLGEEIDRVATAAGVADLLRRPLGRLSRGQRQRVGLAVALLGRPRVLVLDEPTAGLDPAQVAAVRGLIRAEAAAGVAVLWSTHLLAEAAAVCDRVVVLVGGRVVGVERPADVGDLEARFLQLVEGPESP